jgi:hypothetical protein
MDGTVCIAMQQQQQVLAQCIVPVSVYTMVALTLAV